MKTIVIVVWMLIGLCPVSFGQTNLSRSATLPAARQSPKPAFPQDATGDSSPLAHFEDVYPGNLSSQVNGGVAAGQIGTFNRIEHEGLLKPRGQTVGNYSPKIIRVGHTRIYSSVVTAIARKNPVCLLDATFLNISF